MGYYGYRPYVSVAQRRAQAAREVARRAKAGQSICPVVIEGRAIASTFWGQAWCDNLEGYSDFANRLPRGRTYVRNGSVVHLKIAQGRIDALVSGSELYEVRIEIAPLPRQNWRALKARGAGKVGTLVELLQGKLSKAVMEQMTDRKEGLFPNPKEIKMRCSCPDYAGMCKHVAATMYGVGNRLDSSPELLFVLRGVDHKELIEQAIPAAPVGAKGRAPTIAADDLGALFDIEIEEGPVAKANAKAPRKPAAKPVAKKATPAKKAPVAKAAAKINVPPTAKQAISKPGAAKKAPAAKITVPPKAKQAISKPGAAKQAPAAKAGTKVTQPPATQPALKKTPPAKKAPAVKADAKIAGSSKAKEPVSKPGAAKKAPAAKADVKTTASATPKQAVSKPGAAKKAPAAKQTRSKPVAGKG